MSKSPEKKKGQTTDGCPSYLRDSRLAFDEAQHPEICQVAIPCDIDAGMSDQTSALLIDLIPVGSSPFSLVNPRNISINQGSTAAAIACGAGLATSVIDLTPESISEDKICKSVALRVMQELCKQQSKLESEFLWTLVLTPMIGGHICLIRPIGLIRQREQGLGIRT